MHLHFCHQLQEFQTVTDISFKSGTIHCRCLYKLYEEKSAADVFSFYFQLFLFLPLISSPSFFSTFHIIYHCDIVRQTHDALTTIHSSCLLYISTHIFQGSDSFQLVHNSTLISKIIDHVLQKQMAPLNNSRTLLLLSRNT